MTDYYAQLERQLLDAGRRRTARGPVRRAAAGRARLVLAAGAVALVLGAGGAVVPGLLSGSGAGGGAGSGSATGGGAPPPAPRPPAVTPPVARDLLRGVHVAVYNGTTRTGLARTVADRLASHGAQIVTVDTAVDQATPDSTVAYAAGREGFAREVAALLGVDRVEPFDGAPHPPAQTAMVVVVAGSDLAVP